MIQAGKACQALVSEKEIQKKEEGMLCFSELGLRKGPSLWERVRRGEHEGSTYQVQLSETVSHVSSVL